MARRANELASRRIRACVAGAVVSALVACGPSLSSAKSDFKSGRIAEAKETLLALEPRSRSWSDVERAEYVLYRGLVHHALGDRREAARWLEEARSIDHAHPKALSEDDRVRLKLALDALGPQ
jgi:hypothetical protein